MSYTYYDYLELPPGATPVRIEAMADAELKATLDQHDTGGGRRYPISPAPFRNAFTAISA